MKLTFDDLMARSDAEMVVRRARVEELCLLAKEIIRVSRDAPTPEAALSGVLTALVALDDGDS